MTKTPLPPRDTPYLAPGAPTSPMRQALAGLVVALASVLSLALGLPIELPPGAGEAIVAAGFAVYGLVMHRRARLEQAAGVEALHPTGSAAPASSEP